MSDITIANVGIRNDGDGRYSLNDLHLAAGGELRHKPANWLRLDYTQRLCAEVDRCSDLSNGQSSEMRTAVKVIQGGTFQGTFVCKELVYAYAMWVSAEFNLRVLRAYDALVCAAHTVYDIPKTLPDALRLAAQSIEERDEARALADQRAAALAVAAPKVAFHDSVSRAAQGQTVSECAKVLGTGEVRLYRWLREQGFLMPNRQPYQRFIDAGLFVVAERSRLDWRGHDVAYTVTLITGKGLIEIQRRMDPGPQLQLVHS